MNVSIVHTIHGESIYYLLYGSVQKTGNSSYNNYYHIKDHVIGTLGYCYLRRQTTKAS
jgi:hypothetical protein